MRRFGIALLLASSVTLAVGLTAVPAGAGSFQSWALSGHATQITTSTGKSVNVEVFAFTSSVDSNASVSVTLQSGSFSHGETHTWSFRTDNSSFDYSNGTGTLDTGKLPMNFGSLNLTFTKSSQHTSDCSSSGTTTQVRGTLKGALDFDSKSDSWGSVHDNSFAFDTPNFVTVNDSCTGEGNTKVFCSKSVSWIAPYDTSSTVNGSGFSVTTGDKTTTSITGSRLVYLDNTGMVYRSDIVTDSGRAPVIDGSKLTVRTKKGTRISGKAVISGGDSSKHSVKCHKGDKTFTEHYTNHNGGKWSSANGIKFNQTAFADFKTVVNGDNATWTKQTYS